ncbi:DMT family transporter [Actinotalea sp. K2]|uniref:DMT family transporter n=1 Tax=Actinotalea sp. K2 TaxID=2939438 RepID=UPI002016FA27|nr:DMT family transporter [Actinotalea sp. K2]MCL3862665.1 DMT family transporter [Actinotalea sp. K2]
MTAGADARPRRADFGLVVLGAVLWGTGGVIGAVLAELGALPALAVASLRLTGGGLVMLGVLAVLGRLRMAATRDVVVRVGLVAVLAALYQGSYFAAVERGSVSVATLVALGAAPVMVAGWTVVRERRRPPGRIVGALALALAGLGALTWPLGAGGAPGGSAMVLALVAAGAFATLTVVSRRQVPGLGPLVTTGVAFTLAGLLLAPALLRGGGALVAQPAGVWLLVGLLGVVPTAAAYGAYFSGLRTVPATTATLVALLEPLTAACLAALVLGDRLGPLGTAGGVALAVAVIVVRPRASRGGDRSVARGRRPGGPAAGREPEVGSHSPTMDGGLR